jgi:hypothetical protein
LGTCLEKIGFQRMPLTKFRLNNLITSTDYDIEMLKDFSNNLPYTINQGVDITLDWINKSSKPNNKLL